MLNCNGHVFYSPGADIVGINCHFDPFVSLDAMKLMKEGLDKAGLKPYLMVQPLAFMTPDASKQGFIDLPEFPFGKHYSFTQTKYIKRIFFYYGSFI